jgi:hypothetical protein
VMTGTALSLERAFFLGRTSNPTVISENTHDERPD